MSGDVCRPDVEILEVAQYHRPRGQGIRFHIDHPRPGATSDVFAFELDGWVIGKSSAAVAVEVQHERVPMRATPVRLPRPDVASSFPDRPGAARCGFWTATGTLGMAPEFELSVVVRLDDGSCEPLGTIRGRQEDVVANVEPRLRPILVTSLGRSGSTLLMRLLSEHPEVVVEQAHPFETRAAGYWMHALRVLAEPMDPFHSAKPYDFHVQGSWVGHHPYHYRSPRREQGQDGAEALERWFGHDYVSQVAGFCAQSVDGFYERLAQAQGKTGATSFAEKCPPASPVAWVTWSMYPEAGEVFLVRDFRDMLVSMLAFNQRRGYDSFGRETTKTDEEFVELLRSKGRGLLREWELRSGRAFLLRYEDLVADPRAQLTALLDHLRLDASPATVAGILERGLAQTPELERHQTASDLEATVGRWRRDLRPPLRALCADVFADLQHEFGYKDVPA